jgi:UDPglucose 6-dehydrogenase
LGQSNSMNVSVIGLGKLGAPLVAVMASKGHNVIGVDLNRRAVDMLDAGTAPVDEPGLQALLDQCADRVTATTDMARAVLASEITLIIVPTPTGVDGRFINDFVISAVRAIGEALKRKPDYHTVVITSTVMPGSTEGPIAKALEQHSGRKVGRDVGLCYSPEFIALGTVIRDMLRPDMILIGESDPRAGGVLERLLTGTVDNQPQVRRMSLVNAEITKIAVNTYVTTKIAYANMLGELCERLPGADADVVTGALGMDTRIGAKYLRAATGYGGPCFPRDNVAFATLARSLGARADLAEATDAMNRHQIDRMSALVAAHARPGATVAVLGLSYKPDTDVIEMSQGVMLARHLAESGYHVLVHDPKAMANARAVLDDSVTYIGNPADGLQAAQVVAITTPWACYRELSLDTLVLPGRRVTVIDCWRVVDAARVAAGADLVYPGQGMAGPKEHADTPAEAGLAAA